MEESGTTNGTWSTSLPKEQVALVEYHSGGPNGTHLTMKTSWTGTGLESNAGGDNASASDGSGGERVDEARFVVGDDRELMMGHKHHLAAVSPIFQAMFQWDPWSSKQDREIEVPDVQPYAFKVLLRHAADRQMARLSDVNVWEVLKAADKYQVLDIVRQCFSFLLRRHACRHSEEHLCAVLEMAHHLNYAEEYAQSLARVKKYGGRVLRSKASLTLLCRECLVNIVRADDLKGVSEVLVHQAVMTWTTCQVCEEQSPSQPGREALRATAGELIYHVRYLTLTRGALTRLLDGQVFPCLLTVEERDDLLHHQGSQFPPSVGQTRNAKAAKSRQKDGSRRPTLPRGKYLRYSLFVVLLLAGMFCVQYLVVRYLISPMTKKLHIDGTDSDCNNQTLEGKPQQNC